VRRFYSLAVLLLVAGCATTKYAGFQPNQLTDEQLIQELYSVYSTLGVVRQKIAYLIAIKPPPSYVLRGSSSYNVSATAYTVGNSTMLSGTGSGETTYWTEDQNALGRGINDMAVAIHTIRAKNLDRRRVQLEQEANRRIRERNERDTKTVLDFFEKNPDMKERPVLLLCVAAWVGKENAHKNLEEALNLTARKTRDIVGSEDPTTYSGVWYGIVAQTVTGSNGARGTFVDYLRVSFKQDGDLLTGDAESVSGAQLTIQGRLENGKLTGTTVNRTAGTNSQFSGIVAPTQVSGTFSGAGVGQTFEGTVTLVR
jgi:hypothetical protein